MSNFENFENLEVNGEIHADPFSNNNNQIGNMYLYVDWEKRQASIENIDGNATPLAVCQKRHDMIQLSSVVDTEYFKHSVYPRIIPLLQKMSEKYETVWNGSDHVGKFDMDQETQTKIKEDIIEICQDAPEVGMVLFDVYDTCSNYDKDIPEFFEDYGYNFCEVDIDSMNIEEIKKILAGDESLWIGDSDEEIKDDLKYIQKELRDEK